MSTGNTERIRAELLKAAATVPEAFGGYRDALVQAALDSISATTEHDDRRLNINQRFDSHIEQIAKQRAGVKENPTT